MRFPTLGMYSGGAVALLVAFVPYPGHSAVSFPSVDLQIRIDSLKPQNGVLKDTVGNVGSVREIDDGRLLIAAGPTVVGDFKTGRISELKDVPLGRLIPLTRDSTLILLSAGGWMVIDGVKPIGMLPASNAMVASNKELFGAGVDGKVLSVSGGRPASDSAIVSRVIRLTGARDTAAKLWYSPPTIAGAPMSAALPVREQASLAADGWLAILRAHPYRVDWQSPSGQWVRGAPIPVPTIKYDAREKEALMLQLVGGSNRSPDPINTFKVWPDAVEAFTLVSLLLAPTGEALVLRTRSADATNTRYDVIDRRGMLLRQLHLSSREKILGFGKSSVYVRVSVTPAGGRALIERHPWP